MSGRRYTVLTSALVSELWAEYQERPFNISARARALGIKTSTLSYHMRGGKVSRAMSCGTWVSAARNAHAAFRRGDKKDAAAWLREAAQRIEKLHTT